MVSESFMRQNLGLKTKDQIIQGILLKNSVKIIY
jgi:hypothetical protein